MGNDASTEIEIFAEGELEAEFNRQGGAGDLSVKAFVEKSYNDVIRSVIRPPRARYTLDALGDVEFPLPRQVYEAPTANTDADSKHADDYEKRIVRRVDFELENDRGLKLQCSHWQIFADARGKHALATPCIVYLHSNIGSRIDSLRIRQLALARGFSVFAFDFCGSGNSDGIYVTCGWNESKDLHFVLQHLETDDSVTGICFYGHSMGTFPAIVNVACRSLVKSKSTKANLDSLPSYFRQANANMLSKPIKGMILDGAYSKMSAVTEELMNSVQKEGFKIPTSLLKLACAVIQKSVKKRAGVDLDTLRPIDLVSSCYIPAALVTGESDQYVPARHSEELSKKYGGPAMVMRVEGEHYAERSEQVYRDALDFLYSSILSVGMR